jgi:HEAT repeat protein
MMALLLLLGLALAGPVEDLTLAANPNAPESARMEAFERLVRTGATNISHVAADARERWVAVRVLGKVGGDAARTELLALIKNDMPAMRAAGAQALGDLGDSSLSVALNPLLQDPALIVRAAAAEALGKLRSADSVPALAAALAARDSYYRGSSLWVRRHYVVALGEIGHRSAAGTLVRCLDDADEAVAAEAIRSFERIAGFSFADGRSPTEQREAWKRWGMAQGR